MNALKKILLTVVLLGVMGGAASIGNNMSNTGPDGEISGLSIFVDIAIVAIYIICIVAIVKTWKRKI